MNLCRVALFILIGAFVFFLITALCCNKEGYCKVNSYADRYKSGVGTLVSGVAECPTRKCNSQPSLEKQYSQKYYINGMDTPEQVAEYVKNKAMDQYFKMKNICTNPDTKYPVGNPMAMYGGGSGTGAFAIDGTQLRNLNNMYTGLNNNGNNFYEGFDTEENINNKEGFQQTPTMETPCGTDACGLPETMCNDKCGDPNTYVYDRMIAVVAKTRNYNQGDPIRGDLPICPAAPVDCYGHDWFRPSARPESDLRAGALRFMGNEGISLVNTNSDVNAVRDNCLNQSSNVSIQYSLAG